MFEALTPWHLALILLAFVLLFGYKKLPDASRSLGRSLRIFKGEMKGMKDDDSAAGGLRTRDAAQTTPVRGEMEVPHPEEAEATGWAAPAAEFRVSADRTRRSDASL